MKKRKMPLVTMLLLAILGAWAIVLRFFDFPILPAAPFLKIDFSDLMALIGMLVYGPIGLTIVAGIRDVVNYITGGGEAGIPIGVIMSFAATMAMFLPTHFILKRVQNKLNLSSIILMSISLTTALMLVMALINYYVALPIYTTVLNFPIDNFFNYILAVILPFNLIKGIILSVAQVIVIRTIVPLLNKRRILYSAYQDKEKATLTSALSRSHG